MTIEARLQAKKDLIRIRLLKYTRKAFNILPKLDRPRILDVGCGTGILTMRLAKLSSGEIIGLDINQELLDILVRRVERAGIASKVKVIKCSIFDMEFFNESFDVIWAEGSIHLVGFKRGLQEWRRFLKPSGFMVVHDDKRNIQEKLEQISSCGYELLDHFIIDVEDWWEEYYEPLEKMINELRIIYTDDLEARAVLDKEQRELDMFKWNPQSYASVFFIMKKS